MDKVLLGLIENVKINGISLKAKIDTGADRSSICKSLSNKLKLIQTGKRVEVISSHGKTYREVYSATIEIKSKKIKTTFNLADRNHLKYDVLIGKNILKHGFLIDPSK